MTRRVVLVAGALAIFALAGFFYIRNYVLAGPSPFPGYSASQNGGATTSIHLETVGAITDALDFPRTDVHPDWVSYLPTTVLRVPANSTIQVTIDQEDSATGLRNPLWGKVIGTVDSKMHAKYFDDKGNPQEGDFTSFDPALAAHTFGIPDLGVFVPLYGLADTAPPGSKVVESFSFQTHNRGIYRWQCFVPCAAGALFGNGGAMSTFGYMSGTLIVE